MREETIPFLRSGRRTTANDRVLPSDVSYAADNLHHNFYAMAIAFSINHGCVVTCLAYATAILGNSLGSVSSGILYVCYAITSFLLTKPLVTYLGPQRSLLNGVIGYCVYVGGFLFAAVFQNIFARLSWLIVCLASVVGGVAGALLWTSQGRYFTQHCKLYSDATGQRNDEVTSDYAGIFTFFFLGTELCTKVIATTLYLISPSSEFGTALIFMLYTLVSIASCFVIAAIDDLDDPGDKNWSITALCTDMGASARLVYLDTRLALIMPYQAAFGFGSSFVPYYVFGTVVGNSEALGKKWVGILAALVVLSGAIVSIPASKVANMMGKSIIVTLGAATLVTSTSMFFLFSDSQIGTWEGIIPLLLLYGIGRGIWENTNKAVIADFYVDDKSACTSAFAASSFFTGYAAAMGFFAFPYISRLGMAGVCVAFGLVGLVCYRIAFIVHKHIQQSKSIDKNALLKSKYIEYLAREQAGIRRAYASAAVKDTTNKSDMAMI